MTLPPDASRDGLVQMSDQVLVNELNCIAPRFNREHGRQVLIEAARRLRAASRLSSPDLCEHGKPVQECEWLSSPEGTPIQEAADYASRRLTEEESSPSSAPAATPAQPTYHHEPTCEKLHGGDCTCDPNRLGETHGPLDEESLGGERPTFLDHVDHTGQPIDPVDALRLERESHHTTLQALGDVKRELAHYKAGEQPRVEDRDREIAELKHQIKATECPATPATESSPDDILSLVAAARYGLDFELNTPDDIYAAHVRKSADVLREVEKRLGKFISQADLPAPPAAPRGQWMPMEAYDKNGERWVLLWWPYWRSHPVVGRWSATAGGWWTDELPLGDSRGPTHWMPLPAAPAPASTEEK